MSKICRNFAENVKTWYTVEIENNQPFLILDSLEYKCVSCDKSQYADLSIVPISKITVKCGNCNRKIVFLDEDDFSIRLAPVDEIFGHSSGSFQPFRVGIEV